MTKRALPGFGLRSRDGTRDYLGGGDRGADRLGARVDIVHRDITPSDVMVTEGGR